MTSYWKPRWPNRVMFGSYRDLNYRIDVMTKPDSCFRIRTHAGPGFSIELVRADRAPGFIVQGETPETVKKLWLSVPALSEAIAGLLGLHFSRLWCRPRCLELFCCPKKNDLLPEGAQLTWCLSLLHQLWSVIPESDRQTLSKSEFIEGGDQE